MTVAELSSTLTIEELMEWGAYFKILAETR
jgi:hypothetical protein